VLSSHLQSVELRRIPRPPKAPVPPVPRRRPSVPLRCPSSLLAIALAAGLGFGPVHGAAVRARAALESAARPFVGAHESLTRVLGGRAVAQVQAVLHR
jgi:hypothetical protein